MKSGNHCNLQLSLLKYRIPFIFWKFRKFPLDRKHRGWYRATHVWQCWERDRIHISIHRQRREEQICRTRGEKRHISQILMRSRRNLLHRYRRRRPIIILNLRSSFLILDYFVRPREAGEALNQGHEIPSLGVDDFGRIGVNNYWVMIWIAGFFTGEERVFLCDTWVFLYPQWVWARTVDRPFFLLLLAVNFCRTHIDAWIDKTERMKQRETEELEKKV